MKTSIFDKIAVILAWVLVQTVIGIGCIHLIKMCTNDLASIAVCILNFILCYFWSSKMVKETKKAFGF
jgi:hypothetical protein